jgi:hypothetical protein
MTAINPDTVAKLVEQIPGAHWVPSEDETGKVRDLPWVPYGPGFEIPLYFEYVGGGPFDWSLFVCVIDGRPQCVRLEFSTVDPLKAITPEQLHRFQLGRRLKEATLMVSAPVDEVPRPYRRWESVEQVRAARAAVAMQHRKRPNASRRNVLTDEFLAQVADVYRQHVATGRPSKAVADHFHYKPESARRVVREARLRGLLGPAHAGRGGEQTRETTDA